jgi:geranylgeranyl pyrophosphate synthase
MTMSIIDELFNSERRKKLDSELREIIIKYTNSLSLRDNLLYHFGFENPNAKPSLAHSKRLRAYLCFKFSEHLNISIENILPLSVTLELFHNSTLIIDDIQDNDSVRCNRMSLWKKTNISQAINAAFFLSNLSQAYFHQKRAEHNYYNYSFEISNMINKIVSGQQFDINSSESGNREIMQYEKMAEGKTGALIALSCKMGYMPFVFIQEKSDLIDNFSNLFSILYQIRDDIDDVKQFLNRNKSLDLSNVIYYFGSSKDELNKNILSNNILDNLKIYTSTITEKLERIIEAMLYDNIISKDIADFIKTLIYIDLTKIN